METLLPECAVAADPPSREGPRLEGPRLEGPRLEGPRLEGPRLEGADLEGLVRQHQRMVWRYLRLLGADTIEADDLMQETFLRLAQHLGQHRGIRSPASFLRGIAHNLLMSARRSGFRRRPTLEWSEAVEALVAEDGEALGDVRLEALRHCLARLGGRARQAIECHHLDGLSYADTGARLGLRSNGLRALLSRARSLLRDCMGRYINGEHGS